MIFSRHLCVSGCSSAYCVNCWDCSRHANRCRQLCAFALACVLLSESGCVCMTLSMLSNRSSVSSSPVGCSMCYGRLPTALKQSGLGTTATWNRQCKMTERVKEQRATKAFCSRFSLVRISILSVSPPLTSTFISFYSVYRAVKTQAARQWQIDQKPNVLNLPNKPERRQSLNWCWKWRTTWRNKDQDVGPKASLRLRPNRSLLPNP